MAPSEAGAKPEVKMILKHAISGLKHAISGRSGSHWARTSSLPYLSIGCTPGRWLLHCLRSTALGEQRELDAKLCAPPLDAGYGYSTVMRGAYRLYDRKTQPYSARFARPRFIRPEKPIKDQWESHWRDADPCIGHLEHRETSFCRD